MSGSYSKINYRLRPAKAVERKIICDSLRELSAFGDVATYRYIGFGSTYFSDFILFHKFLHIEDMISIEKDKHAKERFEYNKPFGCIQMKYGDSSDIISTLEWSKKSIVWLDYDSPLRQSILDDIDSLIGNLVPGSVLTVTVSAEPERSSNEDVKPDEYRMQKLKEEFSNENIPFNIKPIDLTGKRLAKLYKRMIDNQLKQSIANFNSARSSKEKIEYKQIFHFNYADGARMLTIGWLLFDKNSSAVVDKCQFNKHFNTKDIDTPYIIEVPNLTNKEVQYLDSKMPSIDCDSIERLCIPLKDIKNYAEIYKYFPSFVERLM